MTNLEIFNRVTTTVFTKCYEEFPVDVDFKYADFFDKEELLTGKRKLFDTVTYTFLWLKEYSYLKIGDRDMGTERMIDAERMIMVSLTEKTLTILNCIPSSLEKKTTLAQNLSDAIKSGSKEAASEILRQIIQCGFKLIPTII